MYLESGSMEGFRYYKLGLYNGSNERNKGASEAEEYD